MVDRGYRCGDDIRPYFYNTRWIVVDMDNCTKFKGVNFGAFSELICRVLRLAPV